MWYKIASAFGSLTAGRYRKHSVSWTPFPHGSKLISCVHTIIDRDTFHHKTIIHYIEHWLEYLVTKIDGESSLLSLPRKLQMDIALDVHIETLAKVQLFHGCDRGLIQNLVLRLKPVLFLPNDLVCKKVTSKASLIFFHNSFFFWKRRVKSAKRCTSSSQVTSTYWVEPITTSFLLPSKRVASSVKSAYSPLELATGGQQMFG